MTELRMRMDNDMLVRGMAERTREAYLAAVARSALPPGGPSVSEMGDVGSKARCARS